MPKALILILEGFLVRCMSLSFSSYFHHFFNISELPDVNKLYVLSASDLRWNAFAKPHTPKRRHFRNPFRKRMRQEISPRLEAIRVDGQDTSQLNVTAPTYYEGFSVVEWPIGAKRVALGHAYIWQLITKEKNPGWYLISEDDAKWQKDLSRFSFPEDAGLVTFFRKFICASLIDPSSKRIIHYTVRGKCAAAGAVAYGITRDFAKILVDHLPMSIPVDHYLYQIGVNFSKAYVSDYTVEHCDKCDSMREHINADGYARDRNASRNASDLRSQIAHRNDTNVSTLQEWLAKSAKEMLGMAA